MIKKIIVLLALVPCIAQAAPEKNAQYNFETVKPFLMALTCGYPEPLVHAPLIKLFVKYSQVIPDWNAPQFSRYKAEEITNIELSAARKQYMEKYTAEFIKLLETQAETEPQCSILELRAQLEDSSNKLNKSSFIKTLKKLKSEGTLYIKEDLDAKELASKPAIKESGSSKS